MDLQIPERGLGRTIYVVAWVVEIAAAIVGLFIAMSLGFAVFNDIPVTERDLGAYTRAVIGALPFVVIAILEPTKILLASGFYSARRQAKSGLALLFLVALGALTFVTFETMFNALIQQNSNITLESRRLVNEKFEVADRLDRVRATITGNRAETPQLIQERFTKVLSDLETERQSRIGEASREQKLLLDTINAQLGALEAQITTATDTPLRDQLRQLDVEIDRQAQRQEADIARTERNYEAARSVNQAALDKITDARNSQLANVENIFFGRGELIASISNEAREQARIYEQAIAEAKATRDARLDDIDKTYMRRIEALQAEKRGLRDRLQSSNLGLLQVKNSEIQRQQNALAAAKRDFTARLRNINNEIDRQVAEVNAQKKQSLSVSTRLSGELTALRNAEDELVDDYNNVRQRYREKIEQVQVYQLASLICGTLTQWCFEDGLDAVSAADENVSVYSAGFDVADIPEDKVRFVATVWFGTTAFIIATMGTFLAYVSFALSDDGQRRRRPEGRMQRSLSVLFLRAAFVLKVLAISVLAIIDRIGEMALMVLRAAIYLSRFIIETVLDFIGVLIDSLRIFILVLSRAVHLFFVGLRQRIRRSSDNMAFDDALAAPPMTAPKDKKAKKAEKAEIAEQAPEVVAEAENESAKTKSEVALGEAVDEQQQASASAAGHPPHIRMRQRWQAIMASASAASDAVAARVSSMAKLDGFHRFMRQRQNDLAALTRRPPSDAEIEEDSSTMAARDETPDAAPSFLEQIAGSDDKPAASGKAKKTRQSTKWYDK